MPPTSHREPFAVLVVLLVAMTAACGETGTGPDTTSTSADARAYGYEEFHAAAEHMEVWAAELAAGLDEHADLGGDAQSPAADLLAGLDFTLRGYEVTLTDVSAELIAGNEHAAEEAREVLYLMVASLEDEIRSLFSDDAADAFARSWERHTEQLINVAGALRDGDEAAKGAALEELEKIDRELATHLQDVTGGRIDPAALEETLAGHVETTIATMEAQAAEDESPYDALREAVDHMTHLAEQLAIPFAATAGVDGEVDARAAKMHAELSGRMAETVWFTADLTGRILASDAAGPARALVDHNAGELTDVVRSVLDAEAAERFEPVWSRHIDLLADYARAVREDDAEVRQQVRDDLTAWAEELGQVLGEAAGEGLDASKVADGARTHVVSIMRAIEAQHVAR